MVIAIFVPLVPLMAQVAETHIFTWKLYPCIDVCLCYLSHKWHKWHKYDNDHNSAREGANAWKTEI